MTSVIAHRGASAARRENTLEAFALAVELGADGVELDVRRTADGTLAVHHDPHLADGRALLELSADELPSHVPDLDAALDACAGLAVVNIEIKNWPGDPDFDPTHQLAEAVVSTVARRRERARVLVSCFHLATVDRVRELDADLPTAWLLVDASDVAGIIDTTTRAGHRAVHPHHLFVGPELVERAHDAGMAVNTWTVDDPERIAWLAGLGVDGIVTNVPDVARQVLS